MRKEKDNKPRGKTFSVARLLTVFTLFSLFFSLPASMWSQVGGGGSIQGTVTDPQGKVVPKANVTVTSSQTGVKVTRVSSETGLYVVTPLAPGNYSLRVEAEGFAPYIQEGILVDAMQITTANVPMSVGTVAVTVTVGPPPVNATNAVVGDTVRSEDYGNLPLNMGGGPRCSTCFVNYAAGEGNGYNGGTQYHNETYVDGMVGTTINMQGNGNEIGNIPVEGMAQGEVQTVGIAAQYQGQGVTSFTTKSGGDHYHGSAFEYFRNTALDTWGFFSKANVNPQTGKVTKPVEHQNEFGGSIGGPIKREKLFFFATAERMMYMQTPNPTLVTLPSMAMRSGDFSAFGRDIYDPLATSCTGGNCKRTQFEYNGVKNVLPPSRISAISKYLQQWLPAPSLDDRVNNYYSGYKSGYNYFKAMGKIDYNVTPSQHLALLYSTGNRAPNPTDGSGLPIPYVTTTATTTFTQLAMITHTWTVNDHMVNELKYGYDRYETCGKDPGEGIEKYSVTAAGLKGYLPGHASTQFPNISFSGTDAPLGWATNNKPTCTDANTYNLQDSIQYTHGNHSLSFGGQYDWYQYNATSGPVTGTNASWAFSNTQTSAFKTKTTIDTNTGSAYASYLLGTLSSVYTSSQNGIGVLGGRFTAFSPFVQDDWKITRKLTLNLGLRWDIYSVWHEVLNRGTFFNMNETNPVTGTKGTLMFWGNGVNSCHCSNVADTWYGNVGPRIGFAYSYKPTTVLHASYGLSYTHAGGTGGRAGANGGTGNNGLGSTRTISALDGYSPADPSGNASTAATWETPSAALPGITTDAAWGTGYTTTAGYTSSGQAMIYPDPYLTSRSPEYINWNFGVQQALTNTLTFTIDYAASRGLFLNGRQNRPILSQQIDPKYLALGSLLTAKATDANIAAANKIMTVVKPYANFSPDATINQMLLPFPQYAGITDQWGNRGLSNYHALEIGLKQRAYKGLTMTMNYTYSKLMDNQGSTVSAYVDTNLYQKNTQSPSKLNLYGTWIDPFGRGHRPVVRALIGNWTFAGIYTYTGSGPLSWGATGCTSGVSLGSCMPNYAVGYTGNPRINGAWGKQARANNTKTTYIDSAAFTVPAAFTMGNVPRTNAYKMTGSPSKNLDFSAKKKIPLYEQYSMTFEAGAFNVTNHTEFGGLNTTVGNASFGRITKQSNAARDIQLSATINF